MQVPFANGYIVTQVFGANPQNYQQFGLKGHEGIDLYPTGSDHSIYCIEDGIVAQDVDVTSDPQNKYGIYVVVFNQASRRKWWYCHMTRNYVLAGQPVPRGAKLGEMGSTGNTTGPHLHLGVKNTDAGGNPRDTTNGYFGFIDPAPVMKQVESFTQQLEQAVSDRAVASKPWMPVNQFAALWKFAQAHQLEDQETDELSLTYNGVEYIVQVFNLGIVYCKKGDYDHIEFLRK